MDYYFDPARGAMASCKDTVSVLRLIADKYLRDNPPAPYVFRLFDETGIQADRGAWYHFDFERRFPDAPLGVFAAALGELLCPAPRNSAFVVCCAGPTLVLLNGETVFSSDGAQERSGEPCRFPVRLQKGLNRFTVLCEKTLLGFGCRMRNAMPQWEPCCFYQPFAQRDGESGFLFRLLSGDEAREPASLWDESGVQDWLPSLRRPPLSQPGLFALWTAFSLGKAEVPSWLSAPGVRFLPDGREQGKEPLVAGHHELLMYGELDAMYRVLNDNKTGFFLPVSARGACGPALVLGPLAKEMGDCRGLGRVYLSGGCPRVWRPALEGTALRPYAEAPLFGRWTYPLGVTLYGMLSMAEALHDDALRAYVLSHVRQTVEIQAYAEYDTGRYGFAGVNQQICWLDALDDCGSFGAMTLRALGRSSPDALRLGERIARYMMYEQPRTPRGAFMRRDDTVWADDMYMSVPFLCRWAKVSGLNEPLDFAARQMLFHKELLYMEDRQVMAHMRCLRRGVHNGIPWSRGNGWVIFSLSELLEALPKDHLLRPELLSFFRSLTAGYLALQDENGLWHQILDDPSSYPETSATAMMICSFLRGVRHGWYSSDDESASALAAARRAWQGIAHYAVDDQGNLYGVCRGSGFSFSRRYYHGLGWNLNDTHGIGIVLLAGTEILKLG